VPAGVPLSAAECNYGQHMASDESHSHLRGARSMGGSTKLPQDSTPPRQQHQLQQASPSSESVALTAGRQQLLKARQLLLSRDRAGAQRAYTLALNQAQSSQQFDLAACFLCHLRLAQLCFSPADGGRGASRSSNNSCGVPTVHVSAREHLEAAWALRDIVLRHRLVPPLGALGVYFRAVGLQLAVLLGEGSRRRRGDGGGGGGNSASDGNAEAVLRSLEELGLLESVCAGEVQDSSACDGEMEGSCRGGNAREAPATRGVKLGGSPQGARMDIDGLCDGCGKSTKRGEAAAALPPPPSKETDGGRGGGCCPDCTAAYDKAVAQGPKSDGTPCAGCDDETQPVAIEPDGKWYCEACIQEFYEEEEEEKEEE
ncbi:unnamed protein product, partial [Ectocarpus sp. 12 AP-2014]